MRFSDVLVWREVTDGDITPVAEDPDYLKLAASLLQTGIVARRLGRVDKGRLKETPAARAASFSTRCGWRSQGAKRDPEMAALLPLIGRAKALARLSAPSG